MTPLFTIVLPVFAVMLTGFAATFTKVFTESHAKALSAFVFNFAIPVMLVRSLATTALPETIHWDFLVAYYGAVILVMSLSYASLRSTLVGNHPGSVIGGFGSVYGNTVLIGIPLVLLAFGEDATLPLFLMISVHGVFLFTITTIALEVGAGGGQSWPSILIKSVKGLSTNPIFVSLMVGVALNLVGITIPETIDKWAQLLGQSAVPCALFAMGASLRAYRIRGDIKTTAVIVMFKLLALPLFVFLLGVYVFELEALWLNTAVLLAALPTGVNVYLFATRYETAEGPAASVVMLSTLLSVATLSVVLSLLSVAG